MGLSQFSPTTAGAALFHNHDAAHISELKNAMHNEFGRSAQQSPVTLCISTLGSLAGSRLILPVGLVHSASLSEISHTAITL